MQGLFLGNDKYISSTGPTMSRRRVAGGERFGDVGGLVSSGVAEEGGSSGAKVTATMAKEGPKRGQRGAKEAPRSEVAGMAGGC